MQGQAVARWSSTERGILSVYMPTGSSPNPSYNQLVQAFLIVCDSVATERLRAELRTTNAWTNTIASTVARDAEFTRIDSLLVEQLESGSYTLLKRCRTEDTYSDKSRHKIKITHGYNNTELNGGSDNYYAIAGGDLYSDKTHVQASSSFSLSDIVEPYNSNNESQLPYAPQTQGAHELKLHMTSVGQAMVHANTGETTEPVFMDDHLNEWRSSRHRRSLPELQKEYRDTIRLVARILSAPKTSKVQWVVQIDVDHPTIHVADTNVPIADNISLVLTNDTAKFSETYSGPLKIKAYCINNQITVGTDYFNIPTLDQWSDYRYEASATVGMKNTDGSKKVHNIFENGNTDGAITTHKLKPGPGSPCVLYSDDGMSIGTDAIMNLQNNDSTFFSDAIYEKLYSCVKRGKNIPRYLASELNIAMTELLDQRTPTPFEGSLNDANLTEDYIVLTPVPPDERDSCGKTIATIRFETGKHEDNFCWSIGHSPMPCLDAMLAAIACVHTLERVSAVTAAVVDAAAAAAAAPAAMVDTAVAAPGGAAAAGVVSAFRPRSRST